MGLDVYIYRYEDYESTTQLEAEYERRSDLVWEQVKDSSDDEKTVAREENVSIATELGLGEYGEDFERKAKLEIDSVKYPDHYFKIGYFRSSYNSGGFNRVVSNMTDGGCLDKVFDANGEYVIKPDWSQAKDKAVKLLGKLNTAIEENGSYRVIDIATYPWADKIDSSEAALKVFLEQKKLHSNEDDMFGSYSSRKGDFFLEGITIVAMIPGKQYGTDYMFCVYESDLSWYVQALEIVIESIDYVLNQDDTGKYYLHWSG